MEFDVEALYLALDAQRCSRGLSWQQVARELRACFADVPARPISPSTLSGMRSRRVVEGDGVLQMLRWLDRTPESFVPSNEQVTERSASLPEVGKDRIIRFDTRAMYVALETQRAERGMTWKQVAAEIGGLQPASLTRLKKGGRVAFPTVMRIVTWLERPAASFVRSSER